MDQIVYIGRIIKPARQRNIRYYLAYVTIYALLFSFFNHLGMLKRITRRIQAPYGQFGVYVLLSC